MCKALSGTPQKNTEAGNLAEVKPRWVSDPVRIGGVGRYTILIEGLHLASRVRASLLENSRDLTAFSRLFFSSAPGRRNERHDQEGGGDKGGGRKGPPRRNRRRQAAERLPGAFDLRTMPPRAPVARSQHAAASHPTTLLGLRLLESRERG